MDIVLGLSNANYIFTVVFSCNYNSPSVKTYKARIIDYITPDIVIYIACMTHYLT